MDPKLAHSDVIVIYDSDDQAEEKGSAMVPAAHDKADLGTSTADEFLADIDDWASLFNFDDHPFTIDPALQAEFAVVAQETPVTAVLWTEEDCLQKILEIFPDIAHDHVRQLYQDKSQGGASGAELCDDLVRHLLDSESYPKERERRQELKRKRWNSQDASDTEEWLDQKNEPTDKQYRLMCRTVLATEFPGIPIKFITQTQDTHPGLFQAYLALAASERASRPPYNKVRSRKRAKIDDLENMPGSDFNNKWIRKQLAAARKKRVKDDEKATLEEENERHARATKAMSECGCCFTEYPTNRMAHCDGDVAHFFCLECAANYISSEIGQSRCRPKCMDTSGCTAAFARSELQRFLDTRTFDKLEQLQQEEDIRLAGLDDLVECPFCDFKAILPPVEVDREFRCRNLDCEKISCRLCRLETHIPQSCEEYVKKNKASVRHTVEEAMSAALIRSCNNCNNKFIKLEGCNKMTCPTCGNKQCYVCSKNITDYRHFDRDDRSCKLYDNVEQFHADEVKKAEKEALAKARAENPHLTEDDLKVKVSDIVKKEERDAVKRGGRYRRGVHAHYVNPLLAVPVVQGQYVQGQPVQGQPVPGPPPAPLDHFGLHDFGPNFHFRPEHQNPAAAAFQDAMLAGHPQQHNHHRHQHYGPQLVAGGPGLHDFYPAMPPGLLHGFAPQPQPYLAQRAGHGYNFNHPQQAPIIRPPLPAAQQPPPRMPGARPAMDDRRMAEALKNYWGDF